MIYIERLKKGDFVKRIGAELNNKNVYKVTRTGQTFGEIYADIISLDGEHPTSISVGYDDFKWELIKEK